MQPVRLKEVREYLGLSPKAVEQLTGISSTALLQMEAGVIATTYEDLNALARLYHHPINYFFTHSDPHDHQITELLARTKKKLTRQDKEQVMRFAHFLNNF